MAYTLPVQRTIVPDVVTGQKLATLAPAATVREAARLMAERHMGAVLIVDKKKLAGIFTERDVMTRVVAKGLDPDRTTLAEVMTPKPDTLKPTDSVRDALHMMAERRYRHLPVVDGAKLIAIVSIRDLYASVMDQLEADVLMLAEGLIQG